MARKNPERETTIVDFLQRFVERRGYCPTFREMGKATGLSLSTLHREVKQLEVMGVVRRDEGRARALRLVHPAPTATLLRLLTEYQVISLVGEHYGDAAAQRLAEAITVVTR